MEYKEENKEIEEINDDNDLTREINLDELYDGAINNTVVIDPITNKEILMENKKTNYALVGAVLAVIALLVLYYINNKTDLTKSTPEITPKTTTAQVVLTTAKKNESGVLNCKYDSKSDSEVHNIVYILNYEEDALVDSTFTYTITSNTEVMSTTLEDLKNQYETLYINNASSINNKFTFVKDDKGFTFEAKTNYKITEFTEVKTEEGKNLLYVKPTKDDTYQTLKEKYEQNGFTCSLTGKEETK